MDEMIAWQKQNYNTANEVQWNYANPLTGAQRGTIQTEPDVLGVDQGLSQRQPNPPIYSGSGIMDPGRYADAFNGRFGCAVDGAPTSCEVALSCLASGACDFPTKKEAYAEPARQQGGGSTAPPANAAAINQAVGTGNSAKPQFAPSRRNATRPRIVPNPVSTTRPRIVGNPRWETEEERLGRPNSENDNSIDENDLENNGFIWANASLNLNLNKGIEASIVFNGCNLTLNVYENNRGIRHIGTFSYSKVPLFHSISFILSQKSTKFP